MNNVTENNRKGVIPGGAEQIHSGERWPIISLFRT